MTNCRVFTPTQQSTAEPEATPDAALDNKETKWFLSLSSPRYTISSLKLLVYRSTGRFNPQKSYC